jgi:hypothetical protein
MFFERGDELVEAIQTTAIDFGDPIRTTRTIRTKSAKILIFTIDHHSFRQMRLNFRHQSDSTPPTLA